jgi:para-nitrobenzyl esterase
MVFDGGFISMHSLLKAACTLAFAGLALTVAVPASAQSLVVKTEQGAVRGKTINSGKVRAFLGLPYAAPPVGALRWKAPQPAAKWAGERAATSFGPHCAQAHVFDDMVFQDSGPSEDCLSLNVYTPATTKKDAKLPVMFWIHGGGYSGGGSNEPRHNGDFLPLKGVVLVTINYRLGVFGFLATEEMAKEADGHAGNYGLLDMIAALNWVKANIGAFGGDPANVTIFGESAGSIAVSTLMASPMAHGLFAKAVGESGSGLGGLGGGDLAEAMKRDGDWVSKLGVKSLAELRALPTDKILEATKSRGMVGFSPVNDGKVLVEPIDETYAQGKQAHVPLLAGWNLDEGSWMANGMTAAKWNGMAHGLFKERAEEFLKLYPSSTEKELAESAGAYGGDSFIAFGTWKWVEAHRKTGQSPVYRYFFTLRSTPSKFHPGSFAFHSDDIEYVFGTLDTRPGATIRPEDRKLSEQMMTYWTNFAKTGNPNGVGVPAWPKYDAADSLIRLDNPISSGPDKFRARYDFLSKGMPALQY